MKSGLCGCGCGEKAPLAAYTNKNRGYFRGKPVRFIYGHHWHLKWRTYKIDPSTHCWNWQGSLNQGGYGTICREGVTSSSHRYFYTKRFGKIPAGLTIDHLCRNTKCVNPEHLEAVTIGENIRRSPVLTKLTEKNVRSIKRLLNLRVKRKTIANSFGVSLGAIAGIKEGRSWADVTL